MSSNDPRIDAYIEKQADFARPVLIWLRERMHAACAEVEETIKWGMPSFVYQGRPLANMAAFKAHMAFGFWYRHELGTGKENVILFLFRLIEPAHLHMIDPQCLQDRTQARPGPVQAGTARLDLKERLLVRIGLP